LAADFEGNYFRRPKPLALHIGVVTNWHFTLVEKIDFSIVHNKNNRKLIVVLQVQ